MPFFAAFSAKADPWFDRERQSPLARVHANAAPRAANCPVIDESADLAQHVAMMANPILRFVETFSGHWAMNLETKVPRIELYEKRIASSKPSLGFFVLLVCSAVWR